MAIGKHDPAKPVRVRVFSPLGLYPQHSIRIPEARLLVREDLIVSAIQVETPEAHGFDDQDLYEFEFLALEEIRFLAAIVLSVHPDDGMAYTYPLPRHIDVSFGLDDDALLEAARQHTARASECGWWDRGTVLPPAAGGPAYEWREVGVDVERVLDVVHATRMRDHLLMRARGVAAG